MKTALFDFHLPTERIATEPVSPRDASRMLVVKDGAFEDQMIASLCDYLQPGDVMVFNDTKVIPARLYGKRGEAKIEVMLHRHLEGASWRVFAKPAKKLKIDDIILFNSHFSCIVNHKHESGEVNITFTQSNWRQLLEAYGEIPLPHYMKREQQNTDKHNYQTVYAKNEGAVAAPTAGLHFTEKLLATIDAKGVTRCSITLHVGAGTFQPVKSKDTNNHIMHKEYYEISSNIADIINLSLKEKRRIIAVGTTSLRALESACTKTGKIEAKNTDTAIFITPGYQFRVVDMLLTNFHLPKSSLFMLVSAFAGLDTMQAAYRHAIDAQYRFYSYGDACLLYCNK